MKRIYLYTTDNYKKASIESIGREQQIEVSGLSGADINRTVASICGVPVKGKGVNKKAPALFSLPEMMLFYGMDGRALDAFLDAYNKKGVESIKRKAVVTPTNLGWTLYELLEALEEEIRVNS